MQKVVVGSDEILQFVKWKLGLHYLACDILLFMTNSVAY